MSDVGRFIAKSFEEYCQFQKMLYPVSDPKKYGEWLQKKGKNRKKRRKK